MACWISQPRVQRSCADSHRIACRCINFLFTRLRRGRDVPLLTPSSFALCATSHLWRFEDLDGLSSESTLPRPPAAARGLASRDRGPTSFLDQRLIGTLLKARDKPGSRPTTPLGKSGLPLTRQRPLLYLVGRHPNSTNQGVPRSIGVSSAYPLRILHSSNIWHPRQAAPTSCCEPV
ncbi:hypothetical protein K525DRAFT_284639 [Schizophyllum commune Loenen D]|nr:hypothetical protein K525DRAFT_284639 [Schizophyllum commune Loenen D]